MYMCIIIYTYNKTLLRLRINKGKHGAKSKISLISEDRRPFPNCPTSTKLPEKLGTGRGHHLSASRGVQRKM